jgi:hypothetical protein
MATVLDPGDLFGIGDCNIERLEHDAWNDLVSEMNGNVPCKRAY